MILRRRRTSSIPSLLLLPLYFLSLNLVCIPTRAEKLGPWAHFKTEPTFEASLLNVTKRTKHQDRLSPEYLFFSLTTFSDGGPWGPQIFDANGDLIFFNNLHEHTLAVGDPHVCDFLGEEGNHFCVGNLIGGVRGRWYAEQTVYDNTYTKVHKYGRIGHLGDADGHENNMLPGGKSFLRLVYNPRQADLTPFLGDKEGYVHDVCFQEVDAQNGKEIFQWCYLDHYHRIADTYVYMNVMENKGNLTSGIAGKGTKEEPWDFLHLNAVDKNDEGDYLVSARHLDQVLKIAGPGNAHGEEPGSTIWRLGGKTNQFEIKGKKDLLFSRQHHVRFVKTTNTETVFTLFDNAWEGSGKPSAKSSSGKTVKINNETMEASLVNEYPHPEGSHAMAQGSMVPLRNGNVFVGWGWLPEYTEFGQDGEVLMHAKLAYDTKDPHLSAYRSYKFPWTAYPHWKPKLLAYSRHCVRGKNSPLKAYVSWNGATEVQYWRFWVSDSSSLHQNNWIPAGKFKKKGFETEVTLEPKKASGFITHVFVEALDHNENPLATQTTRTFVPGPKLAAKEGVKCGKKSCYKPKRFKYHSKDNDADMCRTSDIPAWIALAIVFIVVEGIGYWWSYWFDAMFVRSRGLDLDHDQVQTILRLADESDKQA